MLERMYLYYFERMGFKCEELHRVPGTDGGVSEVAYRVVGPFAYGYMIKAMWVSALVGGWMGTVMGFGTLSGFDLRSLGIAIAGALVVLFLFGLMRRSD